MRQIDGQDVLEWRTTGLILKSDSRLGILVANVAPGSPGAWKDVAVGDGVAYVERFKVTSLSDLEPLLKAFVDTLPQDKALTITVWRRKPDGTNEYINKYFSLRPEVTTPKVADEKGATQAEVLRPASPPGTKKAVLLYDGKTFDQWQNAWRTELSTEKRLEAVKALAAFGANGYGKEAAEAILDVAGEYDFATIDESNAEGKLKQIVLDKLAPIDWPPVAASRRDLRHSLEKYWVPDIANRLKNEPKKWTQLATWLFPRLETNDEPTIAVLQSLVTTGPVEVRQVVLAALVYSSRSAQSGLQLDDKTRSILARALQSKDPSEVQSALNLVLYYTPSPGGTGGGGAAGPPPPPPKLVFQPEVVPLLFHADEKTRQEARGVLRYISKEDAPQVVKQLIAVLKDNSRQPDHLQAIRALAAMGGDTTYPAMKDLGALHELQHLRSRSEDADTIIAVLVAIERITRKNADFTTTSHLITDRLSDEEKNILTKKVGQFETSEFIDRFIRENSNLFPSTGSSASGGGVF